MVRISRNHPYMVVSSRISQPAPASVDDGARQLVFHEGVAAFCQFHAFDARRQHQVVPAARTAACRDDSDSASPRTHVHNI